MTILVKFVICDSAQAVVTSFGATWYTGAGHIIRISSKS